jgi:hypothetical protein
MSEIFDFGFTAVDEQELEAVQQAAASATEASTTAHTLEERLDALYNAVQPLLTNLKANPEKEYIYWPNRTDKVDAFSDLLYKIYKGTN